MLAFSGGALANPSGAERRGGRCVFRMMSTPESEAQALNEHFLELTPARDREAERRASAALVCD
jgi:hypothetical protein